MEPAKKIMMVRVVLWDVASNEDYRLGLTDAANLLGWPATPETIREARLLVGREWVTAGYSGDSDSAEKLDAAQRALEQIENDLIEDAN